MNPTLQATDLSFGFAPKRTLLHHLSFRLEAGTITLLAGPNGAGKSVLLKLVKGLLKETGGSIAIQGTPQKPKERMRHVGLVFQDAPTQIVGRTVEKDIRFGMENLGLDETEIRYVGKPGAFSKLTALMAATDDPLRRGKPAGLPCRIPCHAATSS
jgi:energy-coupling factor transporter ATP-binding protein EcfA2